MTFLLHFDNQCFIKNILIRVVKTNTYCIPSFMKKYFYKLRMRDTYN